MTDPIHHPSSFKDPSGFIFNQHGQYYRHIHKEYAPDYKLLMSGGLHEKLVAKKFLIPHTEINENLSGVADWHITLLPEQLAFITYPYEWCFDQLKDVALICLDILRTSIDHGMILKDATPFNFQFHHGRARLVDTLSFVRYDSEKPWIAYRQFCESFLFPLLINHYLQLDGQRFLSIYPEGLPVNMVAKMLPARSRFKLSVWLHVYLQNKISQRHQKNGKSPIAFSKDKLIRLIDHLQSIIGMLKINMDANSDWNNYYVETILGSDYLQAKERIFRELIHGLEFESALDIGSNDGYFSKILAENKTLVIASDNDAQCLNGLYLKTKSMPGQNIIPILVDLANPSAQSGFRNRERKSFGDRTSSELVSVLAIIHHLVLSRNIPIPDIAILCAELAKKFLIIEFVPLTDSKSVQLIKRKEKFHSPYNVAAFEEAFLEYFDIERKESIPGTERMMYRMKRK
ncbi:MAG: hypothetical protein ACHQEM_01155 [Chitinophagales bacterium]